MRLWSCMSSPISTSSRPYGECVRSHYLVEGDGSLVVDLSCTLQFSLVVSDSLQHHGSCTTWRFSEIVPWGVI